MRYWDTSAIVPLVVDEPGSDLVRGWLREDARVVTWALTRLEIAGAVERRARERAFPAKVRRDLLDRFARLADTWGEVADLFAIRARATALLSRHPLRSADAAQLAAAAVAAEGDPGRLEFVCLDRRLADAAEREGHRVLGWP